MADRARAGAPEVTVGSKWGYTYTAEWRVDAEVNEVKDLSIQTLRRQEAETRELLGSRLCLYQIHSATIDSGVLEDGAVRAELARLRAGGLYIGFTATGPRQRDTIERAVEVGGFDAVQATWNLLEPSAGPALAAARRAGLGVIVKEAVANGRLTDRGDVPELVSLADEVGVTPDALALAAVLASRGWTWCSAAPPAARCSKATSPPSTWTSTRSCSSVSRGWPRIPMTTGHPLAAALELVPRFYDMPRRNRVTPFGELISHPARGRSTGTVAACTITTRPSGAVTASAAGSPAGWSSRDARRAPLMAPGRYTELFLLDEATAFAAGHRPCAECRRQDYNRFVARWDELHPGEHGADAMDLRLHDERVDPVTRDQRRHQAGLPISPTACSSCSRTRRGSCSATSCWSGRPRL